MSAAARNSGKIPFARPYMGREEEEAVVNVLRSGWITTGREALEFEKEFAAAVKNPGEDAPTALAVNSATSGLHLAVLALGIGPGDVALVPSLTFSSTAQVVHHAGGEVVFVDVVPGGFHIDPEALERTIRRLAPRKPKALLFVHYGGWARNFPAVLEIARSHNIPVIEDAAHAFPAFIQPCPAFPRGAWAGNAADIGVFSFYATKTLATGEGGMIVTKNPALAKTMATLRSHGISRPVWDRYTDTKASWYYEVTAPGYKYNLPDILAALGRVQLRRAQDLLAMREAIARRYDTAFRNIPFLTLPPTGPGDARHLYPLLLNLDRLKITRDEFAAKLQERGVGISVHFIPLHTMPYYRDRYGLEPHDLPETLASFRREISLPLWPGMTDAQVDRVIEAVLEAGRES